MSGICGNTTSIEIVYRSCKNINDIKGKIALIDSNVHKDLIAFGYKVNVLEFGFE